jgi:hypothetical protein
MANSGTTPRLRAGGHVGRTEITVIGEQCLSFAQRIRQSDELVQHRRKLLHRSLARASIVAPAAASFSNRT